MEKSISLLFNPDQDQEYIINHLQVLLILLNAILFVMSLYDMLFSRRDGGDPTKVATTAIDNGTTYGNPGYRDRGTNGLSIVLLIAHKA